MPQGVRQVQGDHDAPDCDPDVEERENDGHEYDPMIERALEFVFDDQWFGLSFGEHFKSLLQDFGPQGFTIHKERGGPGEKRLFRPSCKGSQYPDQRRGCTNSGMIKPCALFLARQRAFLWDISPPGDSSQSHTFRARRESLRPNGRGRQSGSASD